jgi:DNA invertase Pin-like site-specific DNA recombinase
MEGIAVAKEAGVYTGSKASIDADAVRALRAEGVGAKEISKRLNISRQSVYRLLSKAVPLPVRADPSSAASEDRVVITPASVR